MLAPGSSLQSGVGIMAMVGGGVGKGGVGKGLGAGDSQTEADLGPFPGR